MGQLKMMYSSNKFEQKMLPAGFEFEFFKGTQQQIDDWLDICSNGLIPNKNPKWFRECISSYPCLVPETDLFFVVNDVGRRVATSAVVVLENKQGYIHMVAAVQEVRGMGLGKAMLSLCIYLLISRGCEKTVLTTDDFRLAAIKNYLDVGFKPVIYDDGKTNMKARWDEVISKLNYQGAEYISE